MADFYQKGPREWERVDLEQKSKPIEISKV